MKLYCKDVDILRFEPSAYFTSSFDSQLLAEGSGANLNNGTLNLGGNGININHIKDGMVIHLYKKNPYKGKVYEIIGAATNQMLTVSIPNLEEKKVGIDPANDTNLNYRILTFHSRIVSVSESILEKVKRFYKVKADSINLPETRTLTDCAAFGTLSQIFISRSVNANADDPNWRKSQYYGNMYEEKLAQIIANLDTDDNGIADSADKSNNVTLRRI